MSSNLYLDLETTFLQVPTDFRIVLRTNAGNNFSLLSVPIKPWCFVKTLRNFSWLSPRKTAAWLHKGCFYFFSKSISLIAKEPCPFHAFVFKCDSFDAVANLLVLCQAKINFHNFFVGWTEKTSKVVKFVKILNII